MSNIKEIRVIDFSEYPGPRFKSQGSNSSEEFYNTILKSAFQEVIDNDIDRLVVNLDGTAGYASSFIDESFGRLLNDFRYDDIKKKLHIVSEEEKSWIDVIFNETLPQWANKIAE